MISTDILTWLREQALTVRAGALGQLLFAGRKTEIGSRAAYIVDITLKIGLLRQKLRFFHQRLMASCLNNAALMEGQRTEAAGSKAATVADQAEFDFPNSRNTAICFVTRMVISHVRKRIDLIHLFLGQRLGRRILNHEFLAVIRLHQSFSKNRIGIAVLDKEALCVNPFIVFQLLVVRQHLIIIYNIQISCFKHGSVNKCDIFDINSAV